MASFERFYNFTEAVAEGLHNLGSDVLKIMLTDTEPSYTDLDTADIIEITPGNGYAAGGFSLVNVSSTQSLGNYKLVCADATLSAYGGNIGPFRYAVLYNSDNDLLIGWVDYGSELTLLNGKSLVFDFDQTYGILQIGPADLPTLANPANFNATTIDYQEIDITWDAVTSATTYILERSLTGTGSWSQIYSGGGTSFNDTGLAVSTTYYYRLKATAVSFKDSDYVTDNATTTNGATLYTTNRVADWRFEEASGRRVYNVAGTVTSDDNIIGFPEQYFNTLNYWNGPSYFIKSTSGYCTITDNYAANRLGNTTASRMQTLAGALVPAIGEVPGLRKSVTLPAGQYTISLWVKSNTGSAQSIRFEGPAASYSVDKAVTTAWTQVTHTFTSTGSSTLIAIRNNAAGAALDILIDGLKINSGTSATTYNSPEWDFVLGFEGIEEVAYDPIWSGSALELNTINQFCHAQSQVTQTLTNVSVHALVELYDTSNEQGYILNAPFLDGNFQLVIGPGTSADSSITPNFKFGANTVQTYTNYLADGLLHHLAATYDGTTLKLYIDNYLAASTTASILPQTLSRLLMADNPLVGGRGFKGKIHYASIYSVAHDASQVNNQYLALQSIMLLRGQTMTRANNFIMWEGDSISTVTANGLYPRMANRLLSYPVLSENKATVGATVSTLTARAATIDTYLNNGFSNTILFVLLGSNDMSGAIDGTTFYNNLKTYCNARKAAGWTVVACTPLACVNSGYSAKRAVAASLIRGDNSFYDALVDFAADTTFGPDSSATNLTLFADGVHPTTYGYSLMAPIVASVVDTLLIN